MNDQHEPEEKPQPDDAGEASARALDAIRPGHKITITRVRPSWCRGLLEQIDVVEGEPIDTDYLINTWGGEVLRLKITDERSRFVAQSDIPLYSYEPRRRGKLLALPEIETERKLAESPPPATYAAPPPVPYPYPVASPAPAVDSSQALANLIGATTKLSENQQRQFANYIDFLNRTAQPQTSPFAGLDSVVAFARVFEQLRGIFGTPGPATPPPVGDGEAALLPLIADIVKGVMNKPAEQPRKAQIVPPRGTAAPPVFAGGPPPPQTDQLGSLARALSGLTPEQSAEVVAGAFGLMEPQRREAAINRFFDLIGAEADDDDDDDDGNDEPDPKVQQP